MEGGGGVEEGEEKEEEEEKEEGLAIAGQADVSASWACQQF